MNSLIEPLLLIAIGTAVAVAGGSTGPWSVGACVVVVGLVVLVIATRQLGRNHEAWNRRNSALRDPETPR